MDSEQVSIVIAPTKDPGALDDLYEAAWELLAETIRKNAKHKSTGVVLEEYVPDTREDGRGASTKDALSFVFTSPSSACDVQMAVTAHWFELAAAVAAAELAEICMGNGFELRAPKQAALAMANAPRELPFIPRGEAIVAVVRGKQPAIRTDDEGELSLEEAELAPAAKKLARAANATGVCACAFCDKVRAKKAVAAKPKKAKPAKATKPGVLPKLEHFTSLAKAVKSPDRVGSIEVPAKGHAETEIPEDIGKLQRLRSLMIKGYVTRLPASLFELRELELLIVPTPGVDIPDALGELTKLKTLSIGGTRVPETIARLTELQSLWLRYSRATVIPEAVTQLSKLVSLELADMPSLEEPLPNLGLLTALRRLVISAPTNTPKPIRIENVDFSALKALTYLELRWVTALPATLRDMPALEDLKIEHVEVDWPAGFDNLPKLQRIQFYGSKIASLDALRSMPALEYLSIRDGTLGRLPDAAPNLPRLKALALDGTKLEHAPLWLADLPALEHLNLSRTRVPQEEIAALKAKKPGLEVTG